MERAIEDCLVTGFEIYEPGLARFAAPSDVHIAAAAQKLSMDSGGEEVTIVTQNLRGFDAASLGRLSIAVASPDQLFSQILTEEQDSFVAVLQDLRRDQTKSNPTPEQLLGYFDRRGSRRRSDSPRHWSAACELGSTLSGCSNQDRFKYPPYRYSPLIRFADTCKISVSQIK